MTFAFNCNQSTLLKLVAEGLKYLTCLFSNLNFLITKIIEIKLKITNLYASSFSSTLHTRCNVNGVTPNVVVGFPSSNYPGRYGAMVDAQFKHEMIERLFVDALQGFL